MDGTIEPPITMMHLSPISICDIATQSALSTVRRIESWPCSRPERIGIARICGMCKKSIALALPLHAIDRSPEASDSSWACPKKALAN